MKRYLAYDGINGDYEKFETIEEAREWLKEGFFRPGEGYHPDLKSCKIYELKEVVDYDVIDSKSNYKYVDETDIPEGDEESEAWPYDSAFDEIWQHKFIPINNPQTSER